MIALTVVRQSKTTIERLTTVEVMARVVSSAWLIKRSSDFRENYITAF